MFDVTLNRDFVSYKISHKIPLSDVFESDGISIRHKFAVQLFFHVYGHVVERKPEAERDFRAHLALGASVNALHSAIGAITLADTMFERLAPLLRRSEARGLSRHKAEQEFKKLFRSEGFELGPGEIAGIVVATELIGSTRNPKSHANTNGDGTNFEFECMTALIESGFKVERTPVTGDYGVDLIAEKDGLRFAIQCKAHGRKVGISAVQEAVSGRRKYHCDYAVVVSRSDFTSAAIELATENKAMLVNLGTISKLLDLVGM